MEGRILKILFSKSGSGSTNTRIALPIKDLKDMGISKENREVMYSYDKENKQIIITKAK